MEFDPLPPKPQSAKFTSPKSTSTKPESSEPEALRSEAPNPEASALGASTSERTGSGPVPTPAPEQAGVDGVRLQGSAPRIDPLKAAAGSGTGAVGGMSSGVVAPPDDGERRRVRGRRIRAFVVYPLITALLAIAAGVGVAASIRRPEVAEIDSFVPRLVTELYDRNGEVLARYSRENRILLREGEVPRLVQQAMIATEDANFEQHGGIDLKGVMRAMVANVRAGRIREGASTITMQLARELFSLTREQKWWRKVEEAFLAVELEKSYSKQQIITMYANLVNLGHGNYGIEAASRAYFNKSVADLTLPEAATLAGIPQRPSHFSVYRRPEAVIERRNWVLGRMAAEGMITEQELAEARAEALLVTTRRQEKQLGPYFTEDVRRHLIETYGATELYDRGMQVQTTLDPAIQTAAEEALHDQILALDHAKGWRGVSAHLDDEDLESVKLPSWGEVEPEPDQWFEGIVLAADAKTATVRHRDKTLTLERRGIKWTGKKRPDQLLKRGNVAFFRHDQPTKDDGTPDGDPYLKLEQEPELQGAVLVLESSTGAIRALVGGFSYESNEFNRITQAQRQVGSAFKPFVFGAALESGYTAADTLFDGPAIFRGATAEDLYSPRNYKRQYYGIVTLRAALEKSINVFSVKLMELVGVDRSIEFARRSGITSDLPPYPSLALGSADLTPLELGASYATLVNHGIYVEPYMIERISSRDGRTVFEHQTRAHKAMEPQVAYVLTEMLHGVAQRGTAAAQLSRLPIETGGKTGTTNAFTDAWYVGFTPRYMILTWVGYDKKRSIGRGMTGARAALPIWTALVESGLEDGWLQEGEEFEEPPGIAAVTVDRASGLRWSELSSAPIEEFFVEGTEPERTYDRETARVFSLPWYLQEPFYLPKEGEQMPAEIEDWTAIREVWKDKEKRENAFEEAG
ncbi:MAG: PBP1A family penicillin-binding protein [Acidobacteriota bacterium]